MAVEEKITTSCCFDRLDSAENSPPFPLEDFGILSCDMKFQIEVMSKYARTVRK